MFILKSIKAFSDWGSIIPRDSTLLWGSSFAWPPSPTGTDKITAPLQRWSHFSCFYLVVLKFELLASDLTLSLRMDVHVWIIFLKKFSETIFEKVYEGDETVTMRL